MAMVTAAFRTSAGSWLGVMIHQGQEYFVHTDAISLVRLSSLWFSAEVHTSTLRRSSGRNFGYTKRNKNDPQLKVYTSVAGKYSSPQATTAGPRK